MTDRGALEWIRIFEGLAGILDMKYQQDSERAIASISIRDSNITLIYLQTYLDMNVLTLPSAVKFQYIQVGTLKFCNSVGNRIKLCQIYTYSILTATNLISHW